MKIKVLIIVSILIVLNGLLNLKILNLAVSIPEIITVLYFLSKKDTTRALFWHTIFFITSYSNILSEIFLFDNNITSHVSYNYAILNISGIKPSFLLSLLIILIQKENKKISDIAKKTIFYKLFRFFLYCLYSGFILGIIGLLFMGYDFGKFMGYGYYLLYCFCFALSFLYEFETPLKDHIYEVVPYIIAIAVFFHFLCQISGLTDSLIVIGSTSIGAYCFLFIPLLLYKRNVLPIIIIIGLQIFLMRYRTSGKQLYSLYLLFVATLILSFSKSIRKKIGWTNQTKILVVLVAVVASYPLIRDSMSSDAEDLGGNFIGKMESVETLTKYAYGEADMSDVSNSPYIRLAEISNIIYEDIQNPIYLLFGRGYGGYYRDELNMFTGFDLAHGAFSDEQIRSGKFSSGHDTFVMLPMLNGFIGFYLMITVLIGMCKKARDNYLYLTCLMFPLMWFYFDVLMGVMGVMLLYGAEHKVRKI